LKAATPQSREKAVAAAIRQYFMAGFMDQALPYILSELEIDEL
jgi:hypothetical protein